LKRLFIERIPNPVGIFFPKNMLLGIELRVDLEEVEDYRPTL